MRKRRFATWLISLATATTAFSQSPGADRHFYVGVDLGLAKMQRVEIFGNGLESADDESFTGSVKFGYRFNRHFSLETGYADLGKFETTLGGLCLTSLPPVCSGPIGTRMTVDGFLLNAIGAWPLSERFRLTGSAGAIYRKAEFSLDNRLPGQGRYTREGTAWKVGLGAGFPISDRLDLSVDLEHYLDAGLDLDASGEPHTVDAGDATSLTLGIRWRF